MRTNRTSFLRDPSGEDRHRRAHGGDGLLLPLSWRHEGGRGELEPGGDPPGDLIPVETIGASLPESAQDMEEHLGALCEDGEVISVLAG